MPKQTFPLIHILVKVSREKRGRTFKDVTSHRGSEESEGLARCRGTPTHNDADFASQYLSDLSAPEAIPNGMMKRICRAIHPGKFGCKRRSGELPLEAGCINRRRLNG
jgi:hypothetical protein